MGIPYILNYRRFKLIFPHDNSVKIYGIKWPCKLLLADKTLTVNLSESVYKVWHPFVRGYVYYPPFTISGLNYVLYSCGTLGVRTEGGGGGWICVVTRATPPRGIEFVSCHSVPLGFMTVIRLSLGDLWLASQGRRRRFHTTLDCWTCTPPVFLPHRHQTLLTWLRFSAFHNLSSVRVAHKRWNITGPSSPSSGSKYWTNLFSIFSSLKGREKITKNNKLCFLQLIQLLFYPVWN